LTCSSSTTRSYRRSRSGASLTYPALRRAEKPMPRPVYGRNQGRVVGRHVIHACPVGGGGKRSRISDLPRWSARLYAVPERAVEGSGGEYECVLKPRSRMRLKVDSGAGRDLLCSSAEEGRGRQYADRCGRGISNEEKKLPLP